MKNTNFPKTLLFALFCAACLTACEESPSNQNGNRSAMNRNVTTNGIQRESPSASPQTSAMPSPESSETPPDITAVTPAATLTPETGNSNLSQNTPSQSGDYSLVAVEKLVIPVLDIKREQLQDTFKDARSGGRVHDAIDIIAPQGAPVVAAADGEIARFFDSEKGGITIYQFSRDKKLIYYYAHLQRRADGIQPGQFVKQGTVLGYVGDTGNAGAGNFHLHFAIWTIQDPKRYWNGTNLNPYPLLQR